MVTANSASRFKDRNIMSDSYVEQYMRAKKRNETVSPRCLFGKPCENETDEFFEIEQMKATREVFEKYDLSEISDRPEEQNLFPNFGGLQSEISDGPEEQNLFPNFGGLQSVGESCVGEGGEEKQVESNVKFQPKIVTEHDRPPGNNLFVPIDKVEPSGAVSGIVVEEKLTTVSDYWQTSKRRRSSNSKEDPPTSEHTEDRLQQQNNVKGDENPQE